MDDSFSSLVMRKSLLRSEMKKRRALMAQAAPFAGDQLAKLSMERLAADKPDMSSVVAGYWPIQSEINPFVLMQALEDIGYPLALPCLVPNSLTGDGSDGFRMIFRRFSIGDPLISGPFEIRQPSDDAPEVLPDIVLLPLLAFDEGGRRLGYGGGYYDRALAHLRQFHSVKAYGLAFSGQQLAEIPFEVHDQPLDGILTELGVVEARSRVLE